MRTADDVDVDLARPAPTSHDTERDLAAPTPATHRPGAMTMDPRRLAMLQRSAGNAAVATLVRPRPRPVRPVPPPVAVQRKTAPETQHATARQNDQQGAGPVGGAAAAGPVDESEMIAGSGATRSAPPKALDDGHAGHASIQSTATGERAAIVADAAATNAKLDQELAGAQGKLGVQVGAAKTLASGALAEATASTNTFFRNKYTEVMTATSATEKAALDQAQTMSNAARGMAGATHAQLVGVTSGISTALQGRVSGVANRITSVIAGINLPDLPGVSMVRNGIANLVRGAASGVTSGMAFVQQLIQRALSAGLAAVNNLLGRATDAITNVIRRIGTAIRTAANKALSALTTVAAKVSQVLSNILRRVIFPALDKLKTKASNLLTNGQRRAKDAVKLNTDHHLAALDKVAKTAVPAGGQQAGGGGAGGGAEDPAATFHAIGQRSKENNGLILNTVTGRFGSVLASIATMATNAAHNVAQRVRGLASEVISTVSGKVQQAIGAVRNIAGAVAGFVGNIVGAVVTAFSRAVEWVRNKATAPVEQLISFGSTALNAASSFISRAISNVLSGNFSLPSLGLGAFRPTASMEGAVPTEAVDTTVSTSSTSILQIVGIVVAALVALAMLPFIITALAGVALLASAAIVLFGPLALLAALIYGIYRFVKWVATPSKLEITHDTDFSAPDGSPKSRTVVGVGERVLLKSNKLAVWKATAGDPTSTAAKGTVRWKAPFTAGSAEVTAEVVDRSSSDKVAFTVVEPSSITAKKEGEKSFGKGEQGVGMSLDFVYGPGNVSFGSIEAREKAGPASAVKGYYLHEGMPHDHNPAAGSQFFAVGENNHLAGGTRDSASQFGLPAPWEAGSFHWDIPNEFRADESEAPKVFTTTTQEFVMADDTGTTTVTKAGASATRKP